MGATFQANAQNENALIRKGNRDYKEKNFDQSKLQYQKAINIDPANPAANYNLGNARFKKNEYDDAIRSYEETIKNSPDKVVQQKAWYNKGLALMKQQKLDESIEAWKKAVAMDPNDSEARENLQKALLEQRKRQPPPPNNQKKDEKKKQDQNQQPKPQQSKLTKQQVEQYLNALQQKEKDVQEKMNQKKIQSLTQPDKDW